MYSTQTITVEVDPCDPVVSCGRPTMLPEWAPNSGSCQQYPRTTQIPMTTGIRILFHTSKSNPSGSRLSVLYIGYNLTCPSKRICFATEDAAIRRHSGATCRCSIRNTASYVLGIEQTHYALFLHTSWTRSGRTEANISLALVCRRLNTSDQAR